MTAQEGEDHRSTGPSEEELRRLWQGALGTLLANWRGMSTVPSSYLYPHQWSWDSAFIGLGMARWHQQRAQSELRTVFAGQWPSGLLPHIVFSADIPDEDYFPGPSFWESARGGSAIATSGITQPPLHAGAALEIYLRASDKQAALYFLEDLFPRLDFQLDYLRRARDIGGASLLSIVHPWESGLDNSPAWDAALGELSVDDNYPVPARPDIEHIDPSQRPGPRDYSAYVMLASAYRDSGYSDGYLKDSHPFVVEDPLFNACYLWSLEAMSTISGLIGRDGRPYREWASGVRTALANRLWNSEVGIYQAFDVRHSLLSPAICAGGLVPLIDRLLPEEHSAALSRTLRSSHFQLGRMPFGVPSNDVTGATFDRRLYWRGPSWVNTNWMLWQGLRSHSLFGDADLVTKGVYRAVSGAGFYEYFDPLNGDGLGSGAFAWTAALVMDMISQAAEDGRGH